MDDQFYRITEDLVHSYRELGGLNKIDSENLPSKRAIAGICESLLALIFPGFLDEEAVCGAELEMLTNERLTGLSAKMHNQVAKSLRFKGAKTESCSRKSTALVHRFLSRLPEVRRILKTDIEAAYDGDPAARSFEEIILSYPCIEAIAIQRLAHILYKEELPLLPRMMTEWAHSLTGIDIHPGAEIGTHFFIDHGTGVVIGETCRIGNNVKLYDGVTLGARSFPKDETGRIVKGIKRHPDVEDNVTIYANATILGGETVIGKNTTIGASAFLMKSVKPNSLVAIEEQEHRIVDKTQRAMKTDARSDTVSLDLFPLYPERGIDGNLTALAKKWCGDLGLKTLAERVSVQWSKRLTSTAGNATIDTGLIKLNPLVQEISQEEVMRTLKHELAHLIAYERAGRRKIKAHGSEWQVACGELGIEGEERCHELPLPRRRHTPNHAYQCPGCGEVILRVRSLKRYSACFRCCRRYNRGRYHARFEYLAISLEEAKLVCGESFPE